MNKFDIFDRDSIDTSLTKVILSTSVQLAPFLFPGVNAVAGYVGATAGLAAVMPTLYKGLNGILGGDNSKQHTATKLENFVMRFSPTQSDRARDEGFFSMENVASILTSSASQLYSQKMLQKAMSGLPKFFANGAERGTAAMAKATKDAAKIGSALSLGYMAVTSSKDVYSDFKAAGASDAAAGIGMLGTMAAMYGLMNADYFRDSFLKGTWMDESEALGVLKNFRDAELKPIMEIAAKTEVLDQKASLGLFNNIHNAVSKAVQKFMKSPLSGRVEALGEPSLVQKGLRTAWGTGKQMINKAANEGVEEVMEEVSSDFVKALVKGANALGINMKDKDAEKLDFGYTPENVLKRYGETFLGGFLGGAVFAGLEQWEKALGPKMVDLSSKDAKEQMLYMLYTGHGAEMRDRWKVLYDKGLLGNANLSATKTKKNADGNTIYAKGTEDNNQNLYNYKMGLAYMNYLEHTINDFIPQLIYERSFTDPLDVLKLQSGQLEGKEGGVYKKFLQEQQEAQEETGLDDDFDFLQATKSNAILETIKALGLHSNYLSDITELMNDVVTTKAALDDKLNSTPTPTTADEREVTARATEHSREVQELQDHLRELEKKRDDFVLHRQDDVYAAQTLFMASRDLSEPFIKIVQNADDKKVNHLSLEVYAQQLYNKPFDQLSTNQKAWLQKEFDFDNKDGIELRTRASKLYYKVLELMSPKIKEIDNKLKNLTPNNYYNHNFITALSHDFEVYEVNKKDAAELAVEIPQLQAALKTRNTELSNEILADDKYAAIKEQIEDLNQKYLNGENIDDSVKAPYEEYRNALEDAQNNDESFQAISEQIKNDQVKKVALDKDITTYENRVNTRTDLLDESVTEAGINTYVDPIFATLNK